MGCFNLKINGCISILNMLEGAWKWCVFWILAASSCLQKCYTSGPFFEYKAVNLLVIIIRDESKGSELKIDEVSL